MGERFWNFLRTYCLESTLVGLKYFYLYPDFLSRCFWTLNLIFVLGSSCAITWLLYCRFEEMPTRITIENQFESLYNLPYPTVTICSPNQMTLSSMSYFDKSFIDGNRTISLEKTLPMLLGFYELNEDMDENILQELQNILDLNRYTIAEVMGKMPLSCDRFLKRCILNGKLRNCKELFKPILTHHGYCCAFNSKYSFNGRNVQVDHAFVRHLVTSTGLGSSLSVITDYEPDDAITGTILNAGAVRVMLTDWTEFPVDYETYLVDSNGEAYLLLRAMYTYCSDEVQTFAPHSRKCYFEHERRMGFFRHYRNSDCDLMCYVLAVFNKCKCWLFFLPAHHLDSLCKATHIPCIMDVKKNTGTWMTAEQCDCPRDCESRQYRADLILGNFDALPYMIKSKNPLIGLQINVSTSALNFLFTSPVYVKRKQETVMSIISLVSNLGGVFGLFMGCSGISLLEIFFHIYKGMRNHLHSHASQQCQRQNTIDYSP